METVKLPYQLVKSIVNFGFTENSFDDLANAYMRLHKEEVERLMKQNAVLELKPKTVQVSVNQKIVRDIFLCFNNYIPGKKDFCYRDESDTVRSLLDYVILNWSGADNPMDHHTILYLFGLHEMMSGDIEKSIYYFKQSLRGCENLINSDAQTVRGTRFYVEYSQQYIIALYRTEKYNEAIEHARHCIKLASKITLEEDANEFQKASVHTSDYAPSIAIAYFLLLDAIIHSPWNDKQKDVFEQCHEKMKSTPSATKWNREILASVSVDKTWFKHRKGVTLLCMRKLYSKIRNIERYKILSLFAVKHVRLNALAIVFVLFIAVSFLTSYGKGNTELKGNSYFNWYFNAPAAPSKDNVVKDKNFLYFEFKSLRVDNGTVNERISLFNDAIAKVNGDMTDIGFCDDPYNKVSGDVPLNGTIAKVNGDMTDIGFYDDPCNEAVGTVFFDGIAAKVNGDMTDIG